MSYGDYPFGLRDVVIASADSASFSRLPAARTFAFSERIRSGEMSGEDKVLAVMAMSDVVEWQLEGGGVSLEAYALMTGRSATQSGTGSAEVVTLTGEGQEAFPYFQVYGKSMGVGDDDIHCKLYKCKLTQLQGQFGDGEFWVTQCNGVAIDDGSNGIFDFVQNETAGDIYSGLGSGGALLLLGAET